MKYNLLKPSVNALRTKLMATGC